MPIEVKYSEANEIVPANAYGRRSRKKRMAQAKAAASAAASAASKAASKAAENNKTRKRPHPRVRVKPLVISLEPNKDGTNKGATKMRVHPRVTPRRRRNTNAEQLRKNKETLQLQLKNMNNTISALHRRSEFDNHENRDLSISQEILKVHSDKKRRKFLYMLNENPSFIIHFLVFYGIFLIEIGEDTEILVPYPSLKDMLDTYKSDGPDGLKKKLDELNIAFITNNSVEHVKILKGAYYSFWKSLIYYHKDKKNLYEGLLNIAENIAEHQDDAEKVDEIEFGYLERYLYDEDKNDESSRTFMIFYLHREWLLVIQKIITHLSSLPD
jgi:hypothetical protein